MISMFSVIFLLITANSLSFACEHGGKTYKDGETWTSRNVFNMKCTFSEDGSWKTEVIGCVTPDGKPVATNSTAEDGRSIWTCTVTPDGKVSLRQAVNEKAPCGEHPVGEKWVKESFEFECHGGGREEIIGCVAQNGEKIELGSEKVIEGHKMECKKTADGGIRFASAQLA
ncbi:hypothetical protein AB6A40_005983 [Gnathostoma spinigerum]|uniref:Abnormal cell migration protein 18-like fibronectin type I domain-containing protein n=1 Tax=Gnathostoma spinigerum TaxID=75299 RepID=A0ABD6EH23_9BILA